jgi:hypothetical protein
LLSEWRPSAAHTPTFCPRDGSGGQAFVVLVRCAWASPRGFLDILDLQKLNPVFCLQAFEVTCNLRVCAGTTKIERIKKVWSHIFLAVDISGLPLSRSTLRFSRHHHFLNTKAGNGRRGPHFPSAHQGYRQPSWHPQRPRIAVFSFLYPRAASHPAGGSSPREIAHPSSSPRNDGP